MREDKTTKALIRLAGGVSHELNNIFMAIDGNLSLISEEEKLPEPIKEMMADCLAAARRGIALSRNLQAYAGRQPLHPTAVDLRLVVNTVARSLLRDFSDSELRLSVPDHACIVRIDPQQAEAALLELAQNSRAAMPSGGTLIVELARVDEQKLREQYDQPGLCDAVRLSVIDNGTGLSPEALERATEPMFTLKKGAGARTGWGLSVVDGFVRQSGGTMSLCAAGNGGTRVDIHLPALPDPA